MLAQALAYDTSPAKNGTESVTPLPSQYDTLSPILGPEAGVQAYTGAQ
jgi:hypothetical protein